MGPPSLLFESLSLPSDGMPAEVNALRGCTVTLPVLAAACSAAARAPAGSVNSYSTLYFVGVQTWGPLGARPVILAASLDVLAGQSRWLPADLREEAREISGRILDGALPWGELDCAAAGVHQRVVSASAGVNAATSAAACNLAYALGCALDGRAGEIHVMDALVVLCELDQIPVESIYQFWRTHGSKVWDTRPEAPLARPLTHPRTSASYPTVPTTARASVHVPSRMALDASAARERELRRAQEDHSPLPVSNMDALNALIRGGKRE